MDINNTNPLPSMEELESLHKAKLKEYDEKRSAVDRERGILEMRYKDFKTQLAKIPTEWMAMYGLDASKDISEMSDEELSIFIDASEKVYRYVYGRIMNFFKTGKWEDESAITNILVMNEAAATLQQPPQNELPVSLTGPTQEPVNPNNNPLLNGILGGGNINDAK